MPDNQTGNRRTTSTFAQMRERLNKVLQVNGKISFGSAIEADDWYRNGDIFGDLAVLLDLVEAVEEWDRTWRPPVSTEHNAGQPLVDWKLHEAWTAFCRGS